eukprot:MONOS_15924.1-p1 / transcript=MONOS_15924.1 / gene=MONOS_15924 / organism=Monocercomonoides_exilis_PA203 / gene_product=unspecified product / transcript_product=unspecified product / location=Mono_scaffold01409:8429-9705(-) / protein_length=291 / sequence_SO=supercontig / SO=protein_coding / is_pseudo=false
MSQNPLLSILEHLEQRNAIPNQYHDEEDSVPRSIIDLALKKYEDPSIAFFRLTGFARSEFNILLCLLSDYSHPQRGRTKAINTLEEQLFLLLNFLHHGSCTLTHLLAKPRHSSQTSTVRLLHSSVEKLKNQLSQLFISFRPERITGFENVGVVVDCTVIPINRPGGKLEYGKKYFSGKHHMYCVKSEVGVNPRLGTVSTVSSVYTGSTHDFTIFKDHYPTFQSQLGGAKILADSAYIGAKPELEAIITKPVGTPELASHRVVVERFFGRSFRFTEAASERKKNKRSPENNM